MQNSKYEVTYVSNEKKDWCFIQTRRIRKIIPTNLKCLDIIIEGTQEKCKITISDGKWGENTPESSNHGKLIPYDGIFSDKKKLFASISLGLEFDLSDEFCSLRVVNTYRSAGRGI